MIDFSQGEFSGEAHVQQCARHIIIDAGKS